MKRIWLIKDESAFWPSVEHLFRQVNADVTTFGSDDGADLSAGRVPDLVIAGAGSLARLPAPLQAKPRVVIVAGAGDGGGPSSPADPGEQVIYWPGERRKLLEAASTMLGIAARRKFGTLIRIFGDRGVQGLIGRSIDFSLTGMAFSAEEPFSEGSRVDVSVSLPGDAGSVRFRLAIVRCFDTLEDGMRRYGGTYVDLASETREQIASFVYRA